MEILSAKALKKWLSKKLISIYLSTFYLSIHIFIYLSVLGNKELICWLLVQNPDAVNAVNNDGKALLHLAALYDKIEICKVG